MIPRRFFAKTSVGGCGARTETQTSVRTSPAYLENVLDVLVKPVAALLQAIDVIGQREVPDGRHEFLAGLRHLAEIARLLHRRRAQLLAQILGRSQHAQHCLLHLRAG